MCEGAVGLGHLVGINLLFYGTALVFGCGDKLVGELVGHSVVSACRHGRQQMAPALSSCRANEIFAGLRVSAWPTANGSGAKIIDDRAIFVCLRRSRSSVTARIVDIPSENIHFTSESCEARRASLLRPYHRAEQMKSSQASAGRHGRQQMAPALSSCRANEIFAGLRCGLSIAERCSRG